MDALGPVSASLAADLKQDVVQHGLVLWPDRGGTFTDFVEAPLRRDAADPRRSTSSPTAAASSS